MGRIAHGHAVCIPNSDFHHHRRERSALRGVGRRGARPALLHHDVACELSDLGIHDQQLHLLDDALVVQLLDHGSRLPCTQASRRQPTDGAVRAGVTWGIGRPKGEGAPGGAARTLLGDAADGGGRGERWSASTAQQTSAHTHLGETVGGDVHVLV